LIYGLLAVGVVILSTHIEAQRKAEQAPRRVGQAPATTPPPVGNPSAVEFEFLDWAQATGYQVDIIDTTTLVVKQTLRFDAQPPQTGTVTLHYPVNVQPVAHGLYAFVARAVLPTGVSPDSVPSDPWQRLPGPPGKPVAIGK